MENRVATPGPGEAGEVAYCHAWRLDERDYSEIARKIQIAHVLARFPVSEGIALAVAALHWGSGQ